MQRSCLGASAWRSNQPRFDLLTLRCSQPCRHNVASLLITSGITQFDPGGGRGLAPHRYRGGGGAGVCS